MRRKFILSAVSLLALSIAAPALAQRAETLTPKNRALMKL